MRDITNHKLRILGEIFQSVLRTLKSWFVHVKHHKIKIFCNYLHVVHSKFKNNCHYGMQSSVSFMLHSLYHLTKKLHSSKNQ